MKGFLYWSAYNNICETIHMDAAPGRLMNGNAVACGNSLAKASRETNANPELFIACVRQFLSTADARTCHVSCSDPAYTESDLGFKTQRHGDFLYVTEVSQEERLAPGMRIVAVGRSTVPFLLKDTAQEVFWGRNTDREDWDLALRMFDDIDVFPGDGHVMRIDLRRYPAQARPATMACERRERACILTVDSLEDGQATTRLLEEAHEKLAGAERLIVDVRHCTGKADDASYLALLPYLCDRDTEAREVFGDVEVRTIYSKPNTELLLAGLDRARGHLAADAGALEEVDSLATDIRAKADEVLAAKRRVTGLQERRAVSELPEVVPSRFNAGQEVHVAADAPREAVLLVGPQTGVGAERLAEATMGMEKVRLVGRATPGATDYANYVTRTYPDIQASFTYPISRTVANCEKRGYARTGLPLDLHVPWAPEECSRDLVLEAALGL